MYVGIIYRIFYGDLSYIGSTIDLKQRMYKHKSNYKCNNNDCSSKEIICYDDYEVEILAEIYYVENKYDINLLNLEREYIEQYECVNKVRPIITEEERKDKLKDCMKEYMKSDKYKEYYKEYNKSDKYKEYRKSDKSKENQKEYRKTDKAKENIKKYEEKNKEKIKERKRICYLKNKSK